MANPFLQGWYGAQQAADARTASQINSLGGLLALQQQVEMAPIQRKMAELQLQAAMTPQPKWQVSERFNERTGQKEKVLIDMNNPANVMPFGGQEVQPLSFQNVGDRIQGVDPITGAPRGQALPLAVSPNTAATLAQGDRHFNATLPIQAANAGANLANTFYNTGMGPMPVPGVGVTPAQLQSAPPPAVPTIPASRTPTPPNFPRVSPQEQSQRDADARRITTAEQNGGAGMIPSSVVLPPRVRDEVIASQLKEKDKPPTEAQGRAALFGSRAGEAHAILNALEDKISVGGLAAKQAVQDLPLVGGIAGVAGNAMLSANQQKVEQAQRNFINAVLRQESGAVISPQEFENARKQYFPQPGDGPDVIAQKKANRETAISGLIGMASPQAQRQAQAQTFVQPGTPMRRSTDDPLGIRR